jgi:hypothetical protein
MLCILALTLASGASGQPVGKGASADSGASQRRAIPSGNLPAGAASAVNDTLKRIATAQEAQTASSKSAQEQEREQKDLEAQQDMAWWAKLMFFATVAGVIVSAGGVFLLIRTFTQTHRATRAAVRSAAIGRQSVRVARASAEKQLRAYINVTTVYAEWPQEIDKNFRSREVTITVKTKNHGATPAHKVRSWAVAKSYEPGDGADFSVPEHTLTSVSVEAPGQVAKFIFKRPLVIDSDEVQMWEGERETLYVFGEIRYEDVFGVERFTRFRYSMPKDGIMANGGRFRACAAGNEAT